MAITVETALQFIFRDQRFLFELMTQIQDRTNSERNEINRIIQQYIVSSLADDNGYLKPNALTEERIEELQGELVGMYSTQRMDEIFAETIGYVDARLTSIDTLMRDLELDDAILGNMVFEMDTVQEQIDRIATGLVRGAYGDVDDEYEGSIQKITDTMNRYRFDRSKPEFTLRSELMESLEVNAGAGKSHSNSVSLTAMAVVDRELRRVQADQAGVEHGLYSGAFDDLIRPFCDTWLGQVERWTFWDSLSNDMPEDLFDRPVSIVCGGINCRHTIIPWDLDWSNGETDLRSRFAA